MRHRGVLGVPGRQQPQEVRLARPVAPEHGDPLAVEDLEVERLHETGQLELLTGDGSDAGASTLEPHAHVLRHGRRLWRAGLLVLAQPGLHRLVLRRHVGADRGLLLQGAHEVLETLMLLVPAPQQLSEPLVPVATDLVVGREAATVHPARTALDRDDPVRRTGQELTVV